VLYTRATEHKWSTDDPNNVTDVVFAKLPEPEGSVQLMAGVAARLGLAVCRSRRAGCEMR
jgi:hypothetical protein